MAVVRPFRALRPVKELAGTIAALPYDVQDVDESREIVRKNPLSFLSIDEPVVNFPEGTDPFDLKVYLKAGELLGALEHFGMMREDDEERFYLYELTMDGRVQTGLVGCVAVDDYLNGVVRQHESTRVDKEADRINHVRGCRAQTGPIFLAYGHDDALDAVFARVRGGEPLFDFTADDGVRHRGFALEASDAEAVEARFGTMGRLYIADGHHRLAAATEVAKARRAAHGTQAAGEEHDYFLAVLFADTELKIWPYERVVRDLNGLTEEEFLTELRSRFDVSEIEDDDPDGAPFSIRGAEDPAAAEELVKPRAKGEFCVYVGRRWYRCHVHPCDFSDDPYDGLDVSILQRRLFGPVLGIADPRRSPRIDFVGGIRGLGELERRCEMDCAAAFALSPTRIEELFAVADEGLLMPPKSTWFEPKPRSGLFIHKI